jgi:hypothetical protein
LVVSVTEIAKPGLPAVGAATEEMMRSGGLIRIAAERVLFVSLDSACAASPSALAIT